MANDLSSFQADLLSWYDAVKRDLPWRHTHDPYAIWVSEIMLQQTTVGAVIAYYERWMTRFPTVESLASADIEEALSVWQGLGYYRRCRNLHIAAKIVSEGGIPDDFNGWLALPGIGVYTAGAICSIALGLPTPAVDGNVERVYSRINASDKIDLKKQATIWTRSLVQCDRPGDVTQALMELGATVCRPAAPVCDLCPVKTECKAKAQNKQDQLPTKKAKKDMVELQHVVYVPFCNGLFGVRKIDEGEWWEGLYEFPRGKNVRELRSLMGEGVVTKLGAIKHTVTHHKITVDVSLMFLDNTTEHLDWVNAETLEIIPMPAPQRRIAMMATAVIEDQIGRNSIGVASVPSSAKK